MNKHIRYALKGWRELAARTDIIGKPVEFRNDIGGSKTMGALKRILVNGLRVTIEREGAESIFFTIHEERDPSQTGDTIFCDLDDNYRQIQILGVEELAPSKA